MNILLIDDDDDTNQLIELLLEKCEAVDEFHIESNANDGLMYLEKADPLPDCVFVDLKMPEIDGFEFIEKYEQQSKILPSETRIYVLSSSARSSDKEKAFSFKSVKGFIVKPLSLKKILEVSEELKSV